MGRFLVRGWCICYTRPNTFTWKNARRSGRYVSEILMQPIPTIWSRGYTVIQHGMNAVFLLFDQVDIQWHSMHAQMWQISYRETSTFKPWNMFLPGEWQEGGEIGVSFVLKSMLGAYLGTPFGRRPPTMLPGASDNQRPQIRVRLIYFIGKLPRNQALGGEIDKKPSHQSAWSSTTIVCPDLSPAKLGSSHDLAVRINHFGFGGVHANILICVIPTTSELWKSVLRVNLRSLIK